MTMQPQNTEISIDKTKTTHALIGLQKGVAEIQITPHSTSKVIENGSKHADAFSKIGMHVYLVPVPSSEKDSLRPASDETMQCRAQHQMDWADIIPDISPKEKNMVITKKQCGAFYGTELELQLRRGGMDTIVICGIATNYGVESTVRFAYEYGSEQILPEDTMSSLSYEMHCTSLNYTMKRLGRVRCTEEILSALST